MIIDKKIFKFYGWVGVAYISLALFSVFSNNADHYVERILAILWKAIYIVSLNYYLFEHVIPKLSRKKAFKSFVRIIPVLLLIFFGLYLWIGLGLTLYIFSTEVVHNVIPEQIGYTLATLIFFRIIKHLYGHSKLKQEAQQLRIEKQEAELSYLKSQTNPHFLFNTLNNIYSLAKDKSDLAPESILRLSKILRFMLYETGGDFISIEQELKIITDYIDLEKLRYDDSLQINLNYNVEDLKQAIPPLLLMPLVENAFKHGVSETRTDPFVNIHLSINNRQLIFEVKNSSEEFSEEQSIKENIGLSNLRRQLKLLYTDYSLTVQQGNAIFTTSLKINLASHV
jgi:sensor histidine kinase YesM